MVSAVREPSVQFDYAALDAPDESASDPRADYASALRLIALRIFEATRPRLEAGAFLLAADFEIIGLPSGRALAAAQNVSPEEVSNRIEEWQRILSLPKNRHNKPESAVRAYELHNTRRQKQRLHA